MDPARPSSLACDAYQLTTLIALADAGRLGHRVEMTGFFRALAHDRGYFVACGQRALVEHAAALRLEAADREALLRHPVLGPRLSARPEVLAVLRALDGFEGEIDAVPEGMPVVAGPGRRSDGSPLLVEGRPLGLYTPLFEVRCALPLAKLVETPWLACLNHQSMVASKAARVVEAAAGRPVYEFGARRTHAAAGVDAAWAAAVAGCAGTSNLLAYARFGIPAVGTMDHFYVQAAERPDRPVEDSELEAFSAFDRVYRETAVYLVDTYDTARGIRSAVRASRGRLAGIRIDSDVTPAAIAQARALLDALGAKRARIVVSDGLDELRVERLLGADGFGVGEQIVCSPDAACGIGAVAKLTVNGYGRATMKLSRGKMTLPGRLMAWRLSDHDRVALDGEPAPSGGRPLLVPLWRGRAPVEPLDVHARLERARATCRTELGRLPEAVRALRAPAAWPLVASDALVDLVAARIKEAA